MRASMHIIHKAKIIWDFLRVTEDLHPADLILILGGHDPSVGPHAASLFEHRLAPLIVASGGTTHVPPTVGGGSAETEADAIASYLEHAGIPTQSILLERSEEHTSE